MNWLSFIYPQTLARFSSKYNKDIRVQEEFGRNKILVQGSRQSGAHVEKLWRHALSAFGIQKGQAVGDILVLGVAGGTVITILHRMYPHSKITGVDIDPVMIDIGKTYFGLEATLICEDARIFVRKKKHYDLILVDVFFGRHIPPFVSQRAFIMRLADILRPHGRIIINFLRELEYQKKSDVLYKKLSQIFPKVFDTALFNNRFFMVKYDQNAKIPNKNLFRRR